MYNQIAVVLHIADHATRECIERVISEVGEFEILGGGPEIASLVITEASQDISSDCDRIGSLLNAHPHLDVFYVSHQINNDILLAAMRVGIREFFTSPLDENELRSGLLRFKERQTRTNVQEQSHQGSIINVIGAKGGVGTTTLAVNLADAFQRMDHIKSVVLIDMNMPYGEVQLFLDLKPESHWGELLRNISHLNSETLMNALTRYSSNLHVLASPRQLEDLYAANPENISNVLGMLRSVFDVVVIDLGMYLDEVTLKAMEVSDAILLSSVQSLTCLANIKRFLDHFRQPDMHWEDKIHIIVNKYLTDCSLTITEMEDSMRKKSFWEIPHDYKNTLNAINQGQTLHMTAPRQPITKSIEGLARQLMPTKEQPTPGFHFLNLNTWLSRNRS